MNRSTDEIAGRRLATVLRYVLFATMVALVVGGYTAIVGPSLGKLRLESTGKLLVPLMVISGLLALPVYAALCRDTRTPVQVLTLYLGFVLTCLIYGAFIWVFAPDGAPVFLVTALVAGHILGMPLFLLVVVLHLVLKRLRFYRRKE